MSLLLLMLLLAVWSAGRDLIPDQVRFTRLATMLDVAYYEILDNVFLKWGMGDQNRFRKTVRNLDLQVLKGVLEKQIKKGKSPIFYIFQTGCSSCKAILPDMPRFYYDAVEQGRRLFIIGISENEAEMETFLSRRLKQMKIVTFMVHPSKESELYDVLIKMSDSTASTREFRTPALIYLDENGTTRVQDGRFNVRKRLLNILEAE